MNCHFCKEAITPGYEVELNDHSSDDILYFCRECVNDMFEFFKSEKAEQSKCSEPKGILGIADRLELVEADSKGHIIKTFKNMFVHSFEIDQHEPKTWTMRPRHWPHSSSQGIPTITTNCELHIKAAMEDPRFLYLTKGQRYSTI